MTDAQNGEDTILVTQNDGIAVVTINRPHLRNAFDLATAQRMAEIIDRIEADPAIRVGILTGAGNIAFSAGADLTARARGEPRAVIEGAGFGGFARRKRRKPFIAAVNGYAVGGGLELAMACELAVATANATFSLPEPLRGLIAGGDCLPHVLSRLPKAVAMEVALCCRRLNAAEAASYGMINAVAEDALATAQDLARQICLGAPLAIAATMDLIQALASDGPGATYDGLTESTQKRLMTTEDAAEGAASFKQKRDPVWSGR